MITMKDIARKAGVSQATVSRVLSGTAAVSPAKRAVVMEWVRKLDFEPNRSARSLAASRSHLIGVMLPDLVNPYFSEILSHIERSAARSGYNVILANSEGSLRREREIFKSLKARQVDGFLAGLVSPDSPVLNEILKQRVRTVVVTQDYEGIDCVSVSHFQGGKLVAEHFLESGIEEFAFFGPEGDEKFLGFRDTLLNAGAAEENIEVIGNEDWWLSMLNRGFHRAREYLACHKTDRRLGVMAVNDPFALGVVHAGQELGIRIPKEMAVVGFDDTFICVNTRPTLSSVSQPTEEIGRLAVDILLKRIESNAGGETDRHVYLEPRLVHRETS